MSQHLHRALRRRLLPSAGGLPAGAASHLSRALRRMEGTHAVVRLGRECDAGRVGQDRPGRGGAVTPSDLTEQAFVLAESALSAAQQAVETADTAETASFEAARLARQALAAAQMAYDFADEARLTR